MLVKGPHDSNSFITLEAETVIVIGPAANGSFSTTVGDLTLHVGPYSTRTFIIGGEPPTEPVGPTLFILENGIWEESAPIHIWDGALLEWYPAPELIVED